MPPALSAKKGQKALSPALSPSLNINCGDFTSPARHHFCPEPESAEVRAALGLSPAPGTGCLVAASTLPPTGLGRGLAQTAPTHER